MHQFWPLQVLGFDDRRDSSKALHRLELRGLLPPWVLDRLAGIFAVTQVGCCTMSVVWWGSLPFHPPNRQAQSDAARVGRIT